MKMLSLLNQRRRADLSTQPPRRRVPAGFTLVEMLVVIAIIGMLAGLVTVGAMAALRRAKISKVVMEVSQLEGACQAYKEKFGEYPPDFTDHATVIRHLAKAFPRFVIPGADTAAQWTNLQTTVQTNWGIDIALCNPANALTFWLGGKPTWRVRTVLDSDGGVGSAILPDHAAFNATSPVTGFTGFSANQQNPFDASPSRTTPFFDFAPAQVSFYTGQLMCYPRGLTGSNANNSFVYFRAENGNYTVDGTPMPTGIMKSYSTPTTTGLVRPAADWRLSQVAPFTWINPQSVQIFSAGLDNLYTAPAGTGPLQFPNGAYGANTFDDITNFSGGTLEDSRK